MKKLAAPSLVAASVSVGRRRLDCANVGEVDAAGGCYRFDSRGCGGPDCCVVDQRVPRRISDGFKKLIASAGWAYRILQANDRFNAPERDVNADTAPVQFILDFENWSPSGFS